MKKKVFIGTLLFVLAAIFGLFMLWNKAQNKQANLLAVAANYPIYGEINTRELVNLLSEIQGEIQLPEKDGIAWKRILENPMEIGISLLSNPILFSNERSWSMAVVLEDQDAFLKWVESTLLKEIPGEAQFGDVSLVMFDSFPAQLQWNDAAVVLQWQDTDHAPDFLSKTPIRKEVLNPISNDGLVNLCIAQENTERILMPRKKGDYALNIAKNKLVFASVNGPHSFSEGEQDLVLAMDNTGELMKRVEVYLAKLTSKENVKGPSGPWVLEINGLDTVKSTKVTYEYDDNFEKKEVKTVTESLIPNVIFSFPDSSANSADFSKIGTYKSFARSKEGVTHITFTQRDKTVRWENPIQARIQIAQLHHTLKTLGIQFEVLDSLKSKGLEFVTFSNTPVGYHFALETQGKPHVVGVLAEFLLHESSKNLRIK